MMIAPTGIIFGLDKELRRHRDRVTEIAIHSVAGIEFIESELAGKPVVLANGGIGKVNAAMAATLLCSHFKCGFIVFSGLAGGLAPGLEAGDLVIATELIQHDHGNIIDGTFHLTRPAPPPSLPRNAGGFMLPPAVERLAREAVQELFAKRQEQSMKIYFGRVISGDLFVLCEATRERLFQTHDALALEMEGAAIAQVAERFGREHLVIRVLSDLAGATHPLDEKTKLERLDAAAELLTKIIMARHPGGQV